MIKWHETDPALKNAPAAPKHKPWRVTRYQAHWYWGYRIGPVWCADFRWYWQANAVSFIWHHLFGYSCNTWRRSDERTKEAGPVVRKTKPLAVKRRLE